MNPRTVFAIAAAAVFHFLFGAVWFTALKQPWLSSIGKSSAELMANGHPGLAYLVALLANLAMAGTIAWVLLHSGRISATRGLIVGLIFGAGLVFASIVTEFAFEARSLAGILIAGLYPCLGCAFMGGIAGAILRRQSDLARPVTAPASLG